MSIYQRMNSIISFFWISTLGKAFGISTVIRYLRNPNPASAIRLMRSYGASIGEKTTVKRTLYIDNAYEDKDAKGDFRNLKIGRNCYIGDGVYFDLSNEIVIGDNTVISGRVSVITHADCHRSVFLSEHFPRQCQPVTIGNDVWLGFGSIILSGVNVGPNSVVAAGSLLRDDVPTGTVYAGVPAVSTGFVS